MPNNRPNLSLGALLAMMAGSPPSQTEEELERLVNADFRPIDEEDKKLWSG